MSFVFCFCLAGQNFGNILKDDANSLWILTPDKFKETFGSPEIYKWKSALKNTLLYDSKTADTKLLFFEHPIEKASFTFKSKRIQGMYLTFAKAIAISDPKTYLEYSSGLKKQIIEFSKAGKPKIMKRRYKGGYRYTYSWRSEKYYISMRARYTSSAKNKFKAAKIRFSIFNRIAPEAAIEKLEDSETSQDSQEKSETNPKIKSNDKGDRFLTVPMIKEKSPKDCLYASIRRIFAYYKTSPKDRSWAKIEKSLQLNTKKAKKLKKVFAYLISECRCDVKKLATSKIFDDFNSISSFVREYNMQAAKTKKSQIDPFKTNSFRQLLKVMDEDVLTAVRSNPKKIKKFKSQVCQEINAAKPVLWVVFLGVIKEKVKPVVSSGGYIRLIVGYNSKTNEVIYSDSWGKGHELKKMTWEKAWAMTLSALAVNVKK